MAGYGSSDEELNNLAQSLASPSGHKFGEDPELLRMAQSLGPSSAGSKPAAPQDPNAPRRNAAQLAAAAPEAPAPEWGQVPGLAAQHLLPDVGENIRGIGTALTHPKETLAALSAVGKGMASQLSGAMGFVQDAAKKKKDEETAKTFEAPYIKTYAPLLKGDTSGLRTSLGYRPFSTLTDIATPLIPAEGAASAGAKLAKGAGMARTAAALEGVAKAANVTRKIIDPTELAIRAGKTVTGAGGSLVRAAHSIPSGVAAPILEDISKFGSRPFGAQSRAYLAHYFGAPAAEVQSGMRKAASDINTDLYLGQQADKMALSGTNPSYQPVYNAIDAARKKLDPAGLRRTEGLAAAPRDLPSMGQGWKKSQGLAGKGLEMFPDAHDALDRLEASVRATEAASLHPNAPAELKGIMGLDGLRSGVGEMASSMPSTATKNALMDVYHQGFVPALEQAFPGYKDLSETAKLKMAHINDIMKTLGANPRGKAGATADVRKALKAIKTEGGKNLFDELTAKNPNLPAMLAGQATQNWGAENLLGAFLTSPVAAALHPSLAMAPFFASSPKMAGALHYGAGLAGGATGAAARLARAPMYGGQALSAASPVLPEDNQKTSAPIQKVVSAIEGHEGLGKERSGSTSAEGPGQFVDATFLDTFKAALPDRAATMTDDQIMALHGTPEGNKIQHEVLLPYLTSTNAGKLQDAGIEPTPGNIYLAHLLNVETAKSFLNAPDDTLAASVLPSNYMNRGNASWLAGKTVGEVKAWAKSQIEGRIAAQEQSTPTAATGGRIQRASGGRIDSGRHEALVNKLMKKAERAKSVSNKVTEPLLEVPDKAIVKALDMAQQAI
jgi:hypothetical protein